MGLGPTTYLDERYLLNPIIETRDTVYDFTTNNNVINVTKDKLQIAGTAVTTTAAELNYLDITTLGTGAASKAVVVDTSGNFKPLYSGHIERPRGAVFEVFDDFTYDTIDQNVGEGRWLFFAGATGTVAAIVASPEGKINMISGTNGGAGVTDASALTLNATAAGSLVSLGPTVFECRVATSHITGATISVGLTNVVTSDTIEAVIHTIKTATIADDGASVTDVVAFIQDSEATDATEWHASSENAGTIAHSSAAGEINIGVVTPNTYEVLRIEVDSSGNALFYIDGVLKFTETTAVATSAVLLPYIGITAEDTTPVATTLSVDYIYFSGTRNPSNS